MQRLKLFCAAILVALSALIGTVATPVLVAADTPQNEICAGIGLTSDAGGKCGDQGAQVSGILSMIVNLLSIVIGIIAVIMIIVAGLRFITSGGDSGKVTSAKNTIVYALIGLVVVVLAQTVVRFVLAKVK